MRIKTEFQIYPKKHRSGRVSFLVNAGTVGGKRHLPAFETREAAEHLAEARRKGVKLGRPEGTTLDRDVFLQKHRDILRHLKSGQSVRNTAKITAKGISTVQRVKREHGKSPSSISLATR
jgi:hypothetical protein